MTVECVLTCFEERDGLETRELGAVDLCLLEFGDDLLKSSHLVHELDEMSGRGVVDAEAGIGQQSMHVEWHLQLGG